MPLWLDCLRSKGSLREGNKKPESAECPLFSSFLLGLFRPPPPTTIVWCCFHTRFQRKEWLKVGFIQYFFIGFCKMTRMHRSLRKNGNSQDLFSFLSEVGENCGAHIILQSILEMHVSYCTAINYQLDPLTVIIYFKQDIKIEKGKQMFTLTMPNVRVKSFTNIHYQRDRTAFVRKLWPHFGVLMTKKDSISVQNLSKGWLWVKMSPLQRPCDSHHCRTLWAILWSCVWGYYYLGKVYLMRIEII